MASSEAWTRRGKLAGPANVLYGRWEVVGYKRHWRIVDHQPPAPGRSAVTLPGRWRTMAEARRIAEAHADCRIDLTPAGSDG